MKAKFPTWYLLTLLLGNCSETFSNSWKPIKQSGSESFGLPLSKSYTSKSPFRLKARYLLDRMSDKDEIWLIEDELNRELTTNLTAKENVTKEDKYQSKLSLIGDYIFGSLLMVSCTLSLLGNGCVLTIFRLRQRKSIPIEVFFVNLAAVDILLSAASYPLSIVASFQHGWTFKELGCRIYAFCCYFLGLSNIYTITAMAFTRYLITCKPVRGNQITCWTCWKMITLGYFLAFVLATMPLFGFGNYEVEPFGLGCTLDWIAKDEASRIYIVLVTILCVLLPFIVLVFCYTKIIILVKRSNKIMKNTGVSKRNTKGSTIQLTLISGLISTGFVIAWFPYTIACLWTSFQGEMVLPLWASPGPALFAKLATVYNPIIYVFLTARYRQDFYNLVEYILCKSSSVFKREENCIAKNFTATNDNESTDHQSVPPRTNSCGIEEDTIEISNVQHSSIIKETSV